MSNRTRIYQTRASKAAKKWFIQYLCEKLDERLAKNTAKDLHINRKTLSRYKNGISEPDLEALAEILAYFGEEEIRIPLKEIR